MRLETICIAAAAVLLTACAGKVSYVRPSHFSALGNVKIVDGSRDAVWNASVPELGKQQSFFILNSDRSSGLISASFSGDPERYLDCGRINSYVISARGQRSYDFPASRGQMQYEVADTERGLFLIDRRMSLEGRVNLVFEEISPTQTRVTANTRYVVSRTGNIRSAEGQHLRNDAHSVSFNTGGIGEFPPNGQGGVPACVATGALEREILNLVR